MTREIRADYHQQMMFPPSLEELLPADHPARFIREFVNALDLKEVGFERSESPEGRPHYADALLLMVWIYGYLEGIRSSRKLERACYQHVALMWLTGMHFPDHNSLWRFWKQNRKALKGIFRKVLQIAVKSDLVDMVLHAVDGSKITAAGSTHAALSRKQLKRKVQELDAAIERGMKEVEKAEQRETGEYRLPQELADAQKLRERVKEKLAELEREQREYLNPADPDAEMMKNHEGTRLAYNAQVVVDGKAGIIVAPDVSTEQNDQKLLVPMLEQVKEEFGRVANETVADAGYGTGEQLYKAEVDGYSVLANLPRGQDRNAAKEYDSANFRYDEANDCCLCPRGGILPYDCTQHPSAKNYAVRRYRCKSAKSCPYRWDCSKDKNGRAVRISPYRGAVERQKSRQRDPKNSKLLKKRMGIVEPIFATVKHLLQFRRWTMRGLEKVKSQWFFVCSLANLVRMYGYWRIGALKWA